MLNAQTFLEEAQRQTGLTDYGDAPLKEGLEKLCLAIEKEAKLTESGTNAFAREVTGSLIQRLKIEEFYRLNPATDDQDIRTPIIVTGLPRTGTTALSHMLSRDPANRSIRRWEAAMPTPPPHPMTDDLDPRKVHVREMLDRQWGTPELKTMNPLEVDDPTESLCFLRWTFQSLDFAGMYHAPSYYEWVTQAEMKGSYEYLKRVLKVLQVNYPDRIWNLKHPYDMYYLDAVQSVFPDAALIWTHRDPVKAVPSSVSIIAALRKAAVQDVDKVELAQIETNKRVEQIERGMAYACKSGSLTIHHVKNADLVRDPNATIRELYKKIGREYSEVFDQKLHAYKRERPMGRFGAHEYELSEFGVDGLLLAKRFSKYSKMAEELYL